MGLAEKYRPRTFDEFRGQKILVERGEVKEVNREVAFEELKQIVEEIKKEISQRKHFDQKFLEALVSEKRAREKELEIGSVSGVAGLWGGSIGKLIENAEFIASFIKSYKQQFTETFFDSFLRKMKEIWEGEKNA